MFDLATAVGLTVASGGALLLPNENNESEIPGSATLTHVESGGMVLLGTGATFTQATLDPGAILISTGVVLLKSTFTKTAPVISGFTIAAAENEFVLNGGTAVHAVLVGSTGSVSEGQQYVEQGGTAINTILSGGQTHIEGTLVGATIFTGDATFLSGSVVTDVHIFSGGATGYSGANVTNTVIDGGHVELDTASDTTVNGGIFVTRGVVTDTILTGGTLLDYGSAVGTTLSGGELFVRYSASDTIVGSGGVVVLSAGVHSLVDTTLLQGGTIDLARFAFHSGATATLSKKDLLTVSAGGKTEKLTLVGNYAGLQFVLGADPSKGTDITVSAASPTGGMAAEAVSAGTGAMLQDMRTGSISAAGKDWPDQDVQVVGGGRSLSLPEHAGSNLLLPHLS